MRSALACVWRFCQRLNCHSDFNQYCDDIPSEFSLVTILYCVSFLFAPVPRLSPFVFFSGGYTIRNVARCWAYETAVALGQQISDDIPHNEYYEYFGPDFKLNICPSNMENRNTPDYLDKIKTQLFQALHDIPHVPSVQFHPVGFRLLEGMALRAYVCALLLCVCTCGPGVNIIIAAVTFTRSQVPREVEAAVAETDPDVRMSRTQNGIELECPHCVFQLALVNSFLRVLFAACSLLAYRPPRRGRDRPASVPRARSVRRRERRRRQVHVWLWTGRDGRAARHAGRILVVSVVINLVGLVAGRSACTRQRKYVY